MQNRYFLSGKIMHKAGNERNDLMKLFGNTNYDKQAYFDMCKKDAIRFLRQNAKIQIFIPKDNEDPLIGYDTHNAIRMFYKYFGIHISDAWLNIDRGSFYLDEAKKREILNNEENRKSLEQLQRYLCWDEFLNGRNMLPCNCVNLSFLINESNFDMTLCQFLKGIALFCMDRLQQYIDSLQYILSDFYEIKIDNNAEFGCHVYPKYNIEIIEEIEQLTKQEPSLMVVLNKMHQLDYAGALQELSKILEPNRKEYEKLFQNGDETLKIDTFFNFVNNYGIRHGKNKKENGKTIYQKEPTNEQLKIFLDFGLSIYRLFNIYQSENEK